MIKGEHGKTGTNISRTMVPREKGCPIDGMSSMNGLLESSCDLSEKISGEALMVCTITPLEREDDDLNVRDLRILENLHLHFILLFQPGRILGSISRNASGHLLNDLLRAGRERLQWKKCDASQADRQRALDIRAQAVVS